MTKVFKRLMQFMTGLLIILLGLIPIFIEQDMGIAIVTTPLGLYIMFTKERIY